MPARMENSLFAFILFPINRATIKYTISPKRPPAVFVSTSVISERPIAKTYCVVSNKNWFLQSSLSSHIVLLLASAFDFLFIAYPFLLNFVANTQNRFNILQSIVSIFQFLTQMPDMHSNCAAVFRVVFIFPNCMKQFLNTYNIPRQRKLTSFPMMMWKKAHRAVVHMRITSDLSNIRKRKTGFRKTSR